MLTGRSQSNETCHLDTPRSTLYLFGSIVSLFQLRSLSIEVREEILPSVYVMIEHLKERDLSDMRRSMPEAQRELMDSLVQDYGRDYKFKGMRE